MRLSPGRFKHRNSEVWWNCLRSAVSIIDTSGERHSPLSCSADHLPYTSHLLRLRKFGRRTDPIRCSVQKITSADFILEIEPKRTSAGEISPPRSSGEPQPDCQEGPVHALYEFAAFVEAQIGGSESFRNRLR